MSGVKYSSLKFEASGDQYCCRKVTSNSQMTDCFVISPDLFKIYRDKQEDTPWDFIRDVFPDLNIQIVFVSMKIITQEMCFALLSAL